MSAPPSPASTIQAHRDSVQQLLPTCHRCRRLRRKCDTQLPSCRLCEKAGSECTFYDHALKQTLPRSYVHSLLTRIEHLEATKKGTPSSSPQSNADTASTHPNAVDNAPTCATQDVLDTDGEPSLATSSAFDVVIPSTSTGGRSRYWGSSSAFALTVEVLQHAVTKGFASVKDVLGQKDGYLSTEEDEIDKPISTSKHQWGHLDESDIRFLVRLYMATLNTMYGFVDQYETNADLQTYLSHRQQPGFSPQHLHGEQSHRFFRVSMMCAISCANQARHQPYRTAECLAYYADAITCVEEVTSEATPASLQALLLLIVFCLFHPRKGDIWKLLDYACRLTIELGYHTEDTELEPTLNMSGGTVNGVASDGVLHDPVQSRSKLRRSTFWGLYAIERIVGQLFGRGSDLPETIITAEYPNSLTSASGISPLAASSNLVLGGTDLGVDQVALQSMSIAHHYRLVYLRSEIFRTMYLPASPPDLGLDWLKDKHKTLSAWRQELAVNDDLAGVATLTCDVGYDATMCFLFQPLLLKALKATQSPYEVAAITPEFVGTPGTSHSHAVSGLTGNPGDGSGNLQQKPSSTESPSVANGNLSELFVASDPFYSAINLIRTYEKIIRAPQRSQWGTYPMTFMSAHYIYLASSTLVAYALLRIDGHVKALRRLGDMAHEEESGSEMQTEELDWNAFMDVSTSCLILLAWCVERWPGMLGVLEAYQKLFSRVTRELILKGAVK